MKNLIIIFICAITLCGKSLISFAQNEPGGGVVIQSPFPITVNLTQVPEDDHGTNVENMYGIQIDFAGEQYATDNDFNVLFYIDDRFAHEINTTKLPAVFKWDFRGLTGGAHNLKIEIESLDLKILATESTVVHVTHQQ